MLRTLKKLIGKWEPKEGVIYHDRHIGPSTAYIRGKNTVIIVECNIEGKIYPCSFKLEKGVYEIHIKNIWRGRTVKIYHIKKEFVKATKSKKRYVVYRQPDAGEVTEIRYNLIIKDSTKLLESK
ncbi:hypothetical protein WIW89_13130 [Stygiolobus sp. CP850M]|jgi:hypothetical protein|uniref:hypothetical protein n=1 Tax=Stygiolobus sp. CP850M TaxID=3133134 RepID=UPI00307D168A